MNPEWYDNDWMANGPDVVGVLTKGSIYKNDGAILGEPGPDEMMATPEPSLRLIVRALVRYCERFSSEAL